MKGQRKKTAHPIHEVLCVLKQTGQGLCAQQRLRKPFVIHGVPDGYFCIVKGRVICPKRRGEKVLVTYSSVLEEEL